MTTGTIKEHNPPTPAPTFSQCRLKQAISEVLSPTTHRTRYWSNGVLRADLIGFGSPIYAQTFDLSTLDGTNGFKINGETQGDLASTVSVAGDLNGDGLDDVIIGAPHADPNGDDSGASYVVFGSNQNTNIPLELAALDGSNGFKITGEVAGDKAGISVSSTGDVNADGIDDVIIGTDGEDSYIVFGNDQGFSPTLALASLNGVNGIKIANEENVGTTDVTNAGDVNGDGIDDVMIAAPLTASNGGASYVVFGSDQGLPNPLELTSLDGDNGFKVFQYSYNSEFGHSVSGAGDFNGDGFDDMIFVRDNEYNGKGSTYVVFGGDQGFSTPLDIDSLMDGVKGFRFSTGGSAAQAGDINGDGIDDIVIGEAGDVGTYLNQVYVLFGNEEDFYPNISVTDINGTNGFKLQNSYGIDGLGLSVSGVGDINGDGIDDVIAGAPFYYYYYNRPGTSFILFGSALGSLPSIDGNELDGTNGFQVEGEFADDNSGWRVAGGGDINGDGFDDLVIGARNADPNGTDSGASYVVFGTPDFKNPRPSSVVLCPGDVNGDGSQEIGILTSDSNPNPFARKFNTIVKNIDTGDTINVVEFDNGLIPVDIEVMEDINANNAVEVAALGIGSVNTQIKDSLTSTLLGTFNFDTDLSPIDLEILPDLDGNDTPEIANLTINPAAVKLNDSVTGDFIKSISFLNQFVSPKDMSIISESANPTDHLAVLGEHNNPSKPDKIQIRDVSDGSLIRNISLGKIWQVKQMEFISDINGNSSQEAAVLRTHPDNGRVSVLVKDTKTGAKLSYMEFNDEYRPVKMAIAADVNGNGADEIVVLGNHKQDDRQKAWVKDSLTKQTIKQMSFNKNYIGQDLAVCSDMNGNGNSELVMLGRRNSDGALRVFIKDAETGVLVATVDF